VSILLFQLGGEETAG